MTPSFVKNYHATLYKRDSRGRKHCRTEILEIFLFSIFQQLKFNIQAKNTDILKEKQC